MDDVPSPIHEDPREENGWLIVTCPVGECRLADVLCLAMRELQFHSCPFFSTPADYNGGPCACAVEIPVGEFSDSWSVEVRGATLLEAKRRAAFVVISELCDRFPEHIPNTTLRYISGVDPEDPEWDQLMADILAQPHDAQALRALVVYASEVALLYRDAVVHEVEAREDAAGVREERQNVFNALAVLEGEYNELDNHADELAQRVEELEAMVVQLGTDDPVELDVAVSLEDAPGVPSDDEE